MLLGQAACGGQAGIPPPLLPPHVFPKGGYFGDPPCKQLGHASSTANAFTSIFQSGLKALRFGLQLGVLPTHTRGDPKVLSILPASGPKSAPLSGFGASVPTLMGFGGAGGGFWEGDRGLRGAVGGPGVLLSSAGMSVQSRAAAAATAAKHGSGAAPKQADLVKKVAKSRQKNVGFLKNVKSEAGTERGGGLGVVLGVHFTSLQLPVLRIGVPAVGRSSLIAWFFHPPPQKKTNNPTFFFFCQRKQKRRDLPGEAAKRETGWEEETRGSAREYRG